MVESALAEIASRLLDEKAAVWLKGRSAPGRDPDEWRLDLLGNLIRFGDYGDRRSHYGWEIHRRRGSVFDGDDRFTDKAPLHWRANAMLGL